MTESDDLDEISVSVDATFSRHVADNALVFYMGRDIEIAFLQVWPSLKTFRPGSEQVASVNVV